MKLVECVPNFSEGRRPEVVSAIRDAIAAVEGAVDAAFAGIKAAAERIDLCKHTGEHPRIGATDVVPFIPLEGSTMEDCIALARSLGERVGRELQIPVYLYERAATTPARENLADVRRNCHRRAPVPCRVQRLPRPRLQSPDREEHRQGGARILGRLQVREGAWPRRRRPGAGVDESGRYREDATSSR